MARDLIQIHRGNEENLPALVQGEQGFSLDKENMFIGGVGGNTKLINKSDINGINVILPITSLKEYALINDGDFNNTANLQALIDGVSALGGGKLIFPVGVYVIVGTVTLKKNVQLIGVTDNYNAFSDQDEETNYASMVRIAHEPIIANTDLFVTDSPQDYGYISGISLQNLDLFGNSNSRYGLDLVLPANLYLKNLLIKRFDEGLRINSSINMRVEQIDIQYCDVVCIRIHGGISTSTTFDNCYIHFTPTPLIIEQSTVIGLSFTNQTIFESCENGLDIYPGNIIDFTDCYTENIPNDGSAKAVINFGVNGIDESDYAKGSCSIKGGTWNGYNSGAHVDSSIFNVDRWANLLICGVKIGRAGNTILKTVKSKILTFISIYEQGITNGLFTPTIQKDVVILGNNYVGTGFPYLATKQIRFNNRGSWSIDESFTITDGDLRFIKDSIVPLWLDANYNIRHNYGGAIGSVEKTDVFGAIDTPTFTGAGFTFLVWAESNAAGQTILMGRRSDGQITQLGSFSGITANRPTGTILTIGCRYFDTTLGIPIYYDGTNWKKFSDDSTV